ncbi:MAG TPA: hypothetical protein VK081_12935 [Planctomycetota bacterium]|nr:hypothetical protein [Planctomycetota bacterium]
MLIRPLLPSIASLALCLGGAIAQSDRTPAQRSPDLQRFERIAEELKRAGDNDLAERLMQAARKISAQARSGRAAGRAAPEDREPRAAAGERPGRDTVRAQGVPGRTDAVTTPRGEGRGQARQPAAAAPGAPGSVQRHEHTHRHEVHHYFHGTPPVGTGAAPQAAPKPAPAPPRVQAQPTPPRPAVAPRVRARDAQAPVTPQPPAPPRARVQQPRPPARVAAPAPQGGGAARARSDQTSLSAEIDGLRREVDELRGLLQRLRAQVNARKPD